MVCIVIPLTRQSHSHLCTFAHSVPSTRNALSSTPCMAGFCSFFKSYLKWHILLISQLVFFPVLIPVKIYSQHVQHSEKQWSSSLFLSHDCGKIFLKKQIILMTTWWLHYPGILSINIPLEWGNLSLDTRTFWQETMKKQAINTWV